MLRSSINYWWWPTSLYHQYWLESPKIMLANLERKLLSRVWNLIDENFVSIGEGNELRTLSLNTSCPKTPLVLVHGMGAGVGLWALNLFALSRFRPLYAFDVLGFGRSSRPKFSDDPMLAEMQFVESIESWREKMGIERMILLGHSLGGFLTTSYAIRYPERVEHLIVADGWGFALMPQNGSERTPVPRWIKVLASMLSPFNPFAGIRALGFFGKHLIRKFRPDLIEKFKSLTNEEPTVVADYIYYCNSRKPSGESAFKAMTMSFGWAKNPMLSRIHKLCEKVPLTMIYGSRSWVSDSSGWEAKRRRQEEYESCFVDIHIIKNAGHHVYADQPEEFNNLINKICSAGSEPRKIRTKGSKLSLTAQDSVSNTEHIHRNAHEGDSNSDKLNIDLSEIKQAARLDDIETIRFQVGEIDA